jgi:hypothetical protein
MTVRLLASVFAFALFAIAGYLSTTVPERLTRYGLALVVLAWISPW